MKHSTERLTYTTLALETTTSARFNALRDKLESKTGGKFTNSLLIELLLRVYEESEVKNA